MEKQMVHIGLIMFSIISTPGDKQQKGKVDTTVPEEQKLRLRKQQMLDPRCLH